MLSSLAKLILGTALNEWILATYWLWPIMEIVHFVGLTLLIGGLLIVDLTMLGLLRSLSIETAHKILPIVLIGFLLNLMTGIMFFIGDPMRYAVNIGFQTKMILIVLAATNAGFYHWRYSTAAPRKVSDARTLPGQKIVAALSLSLWIAVLLLGRLIPYVGTG